jgi:Fe-S-cluster-containing dehydrogenase component
MADRTVDPHLFADLDRRAATEEQPQQAACQHCHTPIQWIDCPTGGWWAHDDHPADGHDAEPTKES